MAIVFTSLGSLADTGNAGSYGTTPNRAPAANTLVLVGVCVSDTAGTVVEPTGVVGAGMVFSLITSSLTFNGVVGSQLQNVSLWRSMSPTPDTSRFTATFPNNATGCNLDIIEASGVSTSGTSGENAIGKSATSNGANVAISTLTLVGPSATSTANAWFSVVGMSTSGATETPQQSWTQSGKGGYATPASGMCSAYTLLSTGTTIVWVGSSDRKAAILAEIVADNPAIAGGAAPSPYYASYYYPRMVA